VDSVDPPSALHAALGRAGYFAAVVLLCGMLRSRARILTLAVALLTVTILEAMSGIAVHLAYGGWFYDGVRVRGTYIYRNHFAGLMQMSAFLGLGLLLVRGRLPSGEHCPCARGLHVVLSGRW
jgi:hypothetical protein